MSASIPVPEPGIQPVTPFERRRQRWIRAQRLGRDEIADLPPHFDPGADYDVAPANEEPLP